MMTASIVNRGKLRWTLGPVVTLSLCFLWLAPAIAQAEPPINHRTVFEALAKPIQERREAAALSNLEGAIVWGASYEMEAFLEMFLATGDTDYLDRFVRLAGDVLEARADKAGEADFRGRTLKAWLNAGFNTQGIPVILPDQFGNPSLALRTTARMGNHRTTVSVTPEEDSQHFTITVRNDWRGEKSITHEGLTLETVEKRINAGPCDEGWIRVDRLGYAPPAPYGPERPPVYEVFMRGHHTGQIVTPMARFSMIVKENPRLRDQYEREAVIFQTAAEESLAELDELWREEGDVGFYLYERGLPHWRDGMPEPFNANARAGMAMIHLHDVTGDPVHLERIQRLARLILRERELLDDGSWLLHYWFGVARSGWEAGEGVSFTTPCFEGWPAVENVSHFQPTLRFLIECASRGIVVEEGELKAIARTFHEKIHRPEGPDGPAMSILLDGTNGDIRPGAYDSACYSFAQLEPWNPDILDHCLQIYAGKFMESGSASVLYGWGVLARMEREAAQRESSGKRILRLETELGTIRVLLLPALSPKAVERVVTLANEGFYDETTFHGVARGRWAEGGSPLSRDGNPETDNLGGSHLGMLPTELTDYPFDRGTVAMAMHYDGENPGADSQFFISLLREPRWDGKYPVIGEVIEGIGIVDQISQGEIRDHPDLPYSPGEPVWLRRALIE